MVEVVVLGALAVAEATLSGAPAGRPAAPFQEAARLLTMRRRVTATSDRLLTGVGVISLPVAAALAALVVPFGCRVAVGSGVGVVWFNAMEVVAWASVWLAGWGANSAYALAGGYRFLAQGLAYELPHMFALITAALAAHSLDLRVIAAAQDGLWFAVWMPVAVAVGVVALLAGLLFKAGAVPGHFWIPDVTEGAPPAIAAFVTTVPKIGAFAALYRFAAQALPPGAAGWPALVAVIAAATMTLGNLAAFGQDNVRRLLAYSTVAAYAVTNLGAFAVVLAHGRDDLAGYAGLMRGSPLLGLSLVVCLLGFVGERLLLPALDRPAVPAAGRPVPPGPGRLRRGRRRRAVLAGPRDRQRPRAHRLSSPCSSARSSAARDAGASSRRSPRPTWTYSSTSPAAAMAPR